MHEFSIATSLAESLLQFAEKERVTSLLSARVSIGELAHIDAEQLSFCYEAITRGTPIEGSTLEIETLHASVHCGHCCYRGRPKYWDEALSFTAIPTLQCPQCGRQVQLIEGQDCAIKTVKCIRED